MVNEANALSRTELVKTIAPYKGYATSDGAALGASIIDANLIGANDFITGNQVLIMDGASVREKKTAGTFDPITGTIPFSPGFSAQIKAGTNYRILTMGGGGGGTGGSPVPKLYVGNLAVAADTTDANDVVITGNLNIAAGQTYTVEGKLQVYGNITNAGTLVCLSLDCGGNVDNSGATSLTVRGDVYVGGNFTNDTCVTVINGELMVSGTVTNTTGSISYNGPTYWDAIYFDPNNGNTLVAGNDGTPTKPLSLEADVLTQLAAKKLSKVRITDSEGTGYPVFTLPADIVGISFWGDSDVNPSVALNGKNADSCDFHYLYLSGANGATGFSVAYNCFVGITDNNGWEYHDCEIGDGFTAGALAGPTLIACSFAPSSSGTSIILASGASIRLTGTGDVAILPDGKTIVISGAIEIGQITGTVNVIDQTTTKLMALPSSVVQIADDAEQTTAALVFTLIKTETIGLNIAGCTIKFDLKTAGGGATAHGRIYKNGVAVGIDQTDATGAYQTFSQTLAGFVAGDTIELWAYTTNALDLAYVRNFRVCYEMEAAPPVGDGVYVDSVNGVVGTEYPIGTKSLPVNNIPDSKTIANARNQRVLHFPDVIAPSYSDFTADLQYLSLQGDGWSSIVSLNNHSILYSDFHSLYVIGGSSTVDTAYFFDCFIEQYNLDGYYTNCHFESVAVTVADGSNFVRCDFQYYNNVDFTPNTGHHMVAFQDCQGTVEFDNVSHAANVIDINSPSLNVVIDLSSCSAGMINIRNAERITYLPGVGGVTVNDFTNKPQAEQAVNLVSDNTERTVFDLSAVGFHYTVDDLWLKFPDPVAATFTVRLYRGGVVVNTATIATPGGYKSLEALFGQPSMAGDSIKITNQLSVAGPLANTTGGYAARSA